MLPAILLVLALMTAACGGGDETPSASTTTPAAAADEATEEETEEVKARPSVAPPAETATSEPAQPTATPEPATPEPAQPEPTVEPDLAEAGADMGEGGAASYSGYTTITDDSGAIQVEVPTEWGQVDGRPYTDDRGRQLFDVRAAPDLEAFAQTWDEPGIIVTASTEVAQSENEVTLLDELVEGLSGACTYLGRQPYDDGLYTGQFDVYDSCGGTTTGYIVVGAVPENRSFVIRVQVQVVGDRDLEALQRALDSFVITGDV